MFNLTLLRGLDAGFVVNEQIVQNRQNAPYQLDIYIPHHEEYEFEETDAAYEKLSRVEGKRELIFKVMNQPMDHFYWVDEARWHRYSRYLGGADHRLNYLQTVLGRWMKLVKNRLEFPDIQLLRTDLPRYIAELPRQAPYSHAFNVLMFFVDK